MKTISSFYFHIPFCKHLCNYCDFYKRQMEDENRQIGDFQDLLLKNWEEHKKILIHNDFVLSEMETVYFGGGTPSLWGKLGADFWEKSVHEKWFHLAPNHEFTMEIDPGAWSEEAILKWQNLGVNRFSVGTQSLDPKFLKIMDRSHDLSETTTLLDWLKKQQVSFSVDFMLGLPFSEEKGRDIIQELETLLSWNPQHVSLYILNTRKHYLYQANLPQDDFTASEYLKVADYLKSKGFTHYEVSNFALPGFESKHNKKYWRSESVAALGPSATGYLALSEKKAYRYKWKVTQAEVEGEELDQAAIDLEKLYLTIRTNVWFSAIQFFTNENDQKRIDDLFKTWVGRELVIQKDHYYQMQSRGFVILDSLMDEIFAKTSLAS